ncbi:hypothetical protein C8R42DRAFT_392233 [Lentinula raphanica]|nr:hypothetical protein C8R42DRAFT_392233 [Lentinula raphanica]
MNDKLPGVYAPLQTYSFVKCHQTLHKNQRSVRYSNSLIVHLSNRFTQNLLISSLVTCSATDNNRTEQPREAHPSQKAVNLYKAYI